MATGDRVFWGVITFVFVCLFWLKYMEKFLSIWIGAAVGVAAFMAVLRMTRSRGEGSGRRA